MYQWSYINWWLWRASSFLVEKIVHGYENLAEKFTCSNTQAYTDSHNGGSNWPCTW